jgi:hypothetical protein
VAAVAPLKPRVVRPRDLLIASLMPKRAQPEPSSSDRRFPHIAEWVREWGWIEIGYDDFSRSFVRALDAGGIIWEGAEQYNSLDDALCALDAGIAAFRREQGI